ncbi:hypothetical protein EPA93_47095 [Ktedonosporobacter rubrisoli]|uniref:Tetratricopeptide repeat protein n=1 Tax=Ktedonosporobacter rubrisoli TaxID=2509675 RepID=A0A4V0Z0G4_KTERU|nr:hypothetical protein [Ktedonosporobacter rubrisoli]QBD83131.1 hypothetical protein EPA93_47095 [Ktedonosporobacter rubrisoli]
MRVEGQLTLAQVALLSDEIDDAFTQTTQVLEAAREAELVWLVARAQCLLGSIMSAREQSTQAAQYFEQAMETFQKRGMRLEYARTLQQYGAMLLQDKQQGKTYQQGLRYLQDALRIFGECKAGLDLHMVERLLSQLAAV